MARWGRTDFRQLKALQKRMQKLDRANFDKFCESAVKELAARMLSKAIRRTPVDQGTLRRGWTIGKVEKNENVYEIEVINPVEYANYVEYGHRTRNHKGWVKGKFMMTFSADEVEQQSPQILEKKLMKFLGEIFDAD